MQNTELNKLIEPALIAAIKAGQKILEIYINEDFKVEYKKDKSPLTVADKTAHDIICKDLELTKIPILSEESKAISYKERKNWKTFWLVDPLDGTKEFIKRNGEFTVNIALIKDKNPILGVIFAPVLKKIYFGYQNKAFVVENVDLLNSNINLLDKIQRKSISLPLKNLLVEFTIVASRSHLSDETEEYIKKLREIKGKVNIKTIGSSLKLCLIAEGSADVYPRFGPTMEWDIAAGHAIINAAGGKLLQISKEASLKYNKENLLNPWFIASNK